MKKENNVGNKYRTDFRVGDRVWSFLYGWEEVRKIVAGDSYPVKTELGSYTLDGKYHITHKYQSIFFEEISIPESATRTLETEPETIEITLDDIARKFGVPIKSLRIKEIEE